MKNILLLILTFSTLIVCGQQLKDYNKQDGWYNFQGIKTYKLQLNDFVKNYKTELGLRSEEQLLPKRREEDQSQITHITY